MTAQTYTDARIEAVASVLADGSALDAARLADKAASMLRSLLSERQAARSVAVSDEDVRVAPWTDCAGAVIRAGYTIVHPSGERGIVEFDAGEERPSDQWRVRYENGERLRLCLQVGDKGRAVVTSPQSHGVAGAVKVPDVLTYANQPGNVCASRLGFAARDAKPGGDSIDHGLSLLQQLQLRGFGIVPIDPSEPEGRRYDAAAQEKAS